MEDCNNATDGGKPAGRISAALDMALGSVMPVMEVSTPDKTGATVRSNSWTARLSPFIMFRAFRFYGEEPCALTIPTQTVLEQAELLADEWAA